MAVADRIVTVEGKRQYVRALFDRIADRYDFITVLLSYGRDRAWKRRLVEMARPVAGLRALDLATGTGDIAFLLSAGAARVVGVDVTARMIQLAVEKAPDAGPATTRNPPTFIVGDMMALPFASSSFDIVTTGYGLRNVPDLTGALAEILRVLKPGGRVLSLDFTRPVNRLVCRAYLAYLAVVGGIVGWLLHGDGDTYRYIPASIRSYPTAPELVQVMRRSGFAGALHRPVLAGLLAIHQATK
jgi:demethylmenaquinone methyltransferase/2-methoxy-6-polyprenyl-1,4-benzoquinol methylase